MNNLQVFKNKEFGEVRTQLIEGEPWFVGRDVAHSLGYVEPHKALSRHIDEDDGMKHPLIDSMGRKQEAVFINESGLYSLILSSKLETSKNFKRWVTSEVLPAIRKTGSYSVVPKNFAEALRLAADQAEQIEKQSQLIGELKPKADYYDEILKNPGLMTITQIAKDYGMSGTAMNKKLHELKVQYKQSDQWLLYSKYHGMGYTHSETIDIKRSDGRADIKLNTKWTQKGRIFLYELLKDDGLLPKIERL